MIKSSVFASGLFVVAATFLASCGKSDKAEDKIDKAPSPPAITLLGFTSAASCPALGANTPAVGDRYVFNLVDDAGAKTGEWTDEITGKVGEIVQTKAVLDLPKIGKNDGPSFALVGGLVSATSTAPDAKNRVYSYGSEVAAPIRNLALGEQLDLPGSEASTIRGVSKTLQGVTRISLIGCGTLSVAGKPEAVHVYEVTDFRRGVTGPPDAPVEAVRKDHAQIFISDRTGWHLASKSGSGAMIATTIPQ